MPINISGHHVEVTSPLREYIINKMGKVLRHFENITDTHVTLTVEKHRQKAEATVRIAGGEVFAQSESADMYASIDALVDKLDRQLIKNKEKHSTRRQANV